MPSEFMAKLTMKKQALALEKLQRKDYDGYEELLKLGIIEVDMHINDL